MGVVFIGLMDFIKRFFKLKMLRRNPPPRRIDKPVMYSYFREYATWKGVYGEAAPSLNVLIEELKEFNAMDLLQALSKISFVSQYEFGFKGGMLALNYFLEFFDKDVIKRLSQRRDISKIYLSRSLILFLQLMALRHSKAEGGKLVAENLLGVGRLLLLSGSYCEGGGVTDEQGEVGHDELKGNLVRNMVFNASEQLRFKLPRYWHIVTQMQKEIQELYPKEVFPFDTIIKEAAGVAPQDICVYTLAVLSNYFKDWEEISKDPGKFFIGPDYFRNIVTEKRAGANRRMQDLSRSYTEFRAELSSPIDINGYNPGPIYKTPLCRLSTHNFFLLDLKSLVDNCTEGVFWMAFDRTQPRSIERAGLRGYWGRLFERYVYHILLSYFPKTFLAPRLFVGDEENFSGVDFIVIDPESAIFIEATNSSVPTLKLLSGNWAEQKKSLDYVLFKTQDGKEGKAFKIANAIKEFRAGRLPLRGVNPKMIKKIYPVLVMERGFPQLPPITSEIRREITAKTGMSEAEHFEIWDIEELEACQSVFRQGLSAFIEQKYGGEYAEWPMQNFLSAIKVDTSNDYTTKIFEDATKAMGALLWNHNDNSVMDAEE